MTFKRTCKSGKCGTKTLQTATFDDNGKPIWRCECCHEETPRCNHQTVYDDGQCAVCGKIVRRRKAKQ